MKNFSLSSVLLVIYLVLSAGYILYGAWSTLSHTVAERSFVSGQTAAVQAVIAEAAKCEPFDLYAGEQRVTLEATTGCDEKK